MRLKTGTVLHTCRKEGQKKAEKALGELEWGNNLICEGNCDDDGTNRNEALKKKKEKC